MQRRTRHKGCAREKHCVTRIAWAIGGKRKMSGRGHLDEQGVGISFQFPCQAPLPPSEIRAAGESRGRDARAELHWARTRGSSRRGRLLKTGKTGETGVDGGRQCAVDRSGEKRAAKTRRGDEKGIHQRRTRKECRLLRRIATLSIILVFWYFGILVFCILHVFCMYFACILHLFCIYFQLFSLFLFYFISGKKKSFNRQPPRKK